ncbi:hypothetical protein Cni_G02981 [Canna indica]|uniref:Uncharacterized protein n=1 Tax=Canna indica TaxID=4628 RepID=A0AAQ3JQ86_9LILI|nr:hypothetical protein Cni_G02981 [Canna indica]
MDSGFYHQNNAYNHNSSSSSSLPLHLCFFLLTLLMFMGLSWYMAYESALEGLFDQLKLLLMASPLVLLVVVHWMSDDERRRVPFFIPLPERESFHRAGGSPWGVGLLLLLLMLMVSYQSYFHDRWFPLLSR